MQRTAKMHFHRSQTIEMHSPGTVRGVTAGGLRARPGADPGNGSTRVALELFVRDGFAAAHAARHRRSR